MARTVRFFVAVLSLLALGHLAFGQGIITGSLSGSVTDPTGAVISNATVTAVNSTTGATLTGITNAEGAFLISNVPIGTYTITLDAQGFNKSTINNVLVVTGNATALGQRTLNPGTAAETVEVEGGASALINTTSSQGEIVFDSKQLQNFPVSGGFDNTALLVPGVVATHDDNMSNTNGTNFSANGQRGRSNNAEIDGQSNNDNSVTGPQIFFSNQDAIQEIQVISNQFSAQYGRNMGSVINYVTKSGTNQFHGSAFEFYTGSWLSSLTQGTKGPQFGFCPPGVSADTGCVTPAVPRFVQNLFGGTLGGPVLKDKLFFFGSTYWGRTYQGGFRRTTNGNLFPTPNGLKQLQSAYPNNPGVDSLVANGPYAFPIGNPAPFGPTSTLTVTDGNTTTGIEVSQYARTLPSYSLDQEHLGRLDYQLSPNDRFYLRYMYQDNPTSPFSGTLVTGGFTDVRDTVHSVGADWTHTFSPTLVNQLRYSFQQSTLAFDGGGDPKCTITNFASCPSNVALGAGLEGYGYPTNMPQGRVVKVTQIQDNASWSKGKHNILFGGEFDYQNSPNVFLPNAAGNFNFAQGATGTDKSKMLNNGISGLLQGVAHTQLTAGTPTDHFTEPDFALYFQDDWKITPTFTANIGLRYEYFGQSINLLHDLSMQQQTGPNPFWDTSLPLSATTFPKIDSFYKNIEPRVGFAWNPSFAQGLVVHGGFAINVDPAFDNIFINIASGTPVSNAGSFNCDGATANCLPSGGLTYGSVHAADNQFIPTGGDPRLQPFQTVPKNFRTPMAESYTLGVQYQVAKSGVAEVRYVGNHTFRQFQALNANPDIADVQAYFPAYGAGISVCTTATATGLGRPDCNYNVVSTTANTAFSNYSALQTSFTTRNFYNWTGTISYTFSRAIDNTSEIFSTGTGGNTNAYAQNPLDPNVAERGVSGNSYPHVVGLGLNYSEPFFKNQKGLLGRLLGGYSFNSLYTYNSGQPFSVSQNTTVQSEALSGITDTLATTSFCDFAFDQNFAQGSCRPILSNPRAPIGTVGINLGPQGYVDYRTGNPVSPSDVHWLWNNRYEALARGNPFPGVGRNTLRGDTFNNLDLSVYKDIQLTERVRMQLQVTSFNILNRGYYGTPDPSIEDYANLIPSGFLNNFYSGGGGGSLAAGGAFSQGTGNRNIQIGGKVTF